MTPKELVDRAIEAMRGSYSVYSGFTVGAALLCESGEVFTAANVENASYGATMCGERNALFYAVAQGHRKFTAVAIVGGHHGEIKDFCPPCGICRQAYSEFCGPDFKIYLYNGKEIHEHTMSELLPLSFELLNNK